MRGYARSRNRSQSVWLSFDCSTPCSSKTHSITRVPSEYSTLRLGSLKRIPPHGAYSSWIAPSEEANGLFSGTWVRAISTATAEAMYGPQKICFNEEASSLSPKQYVDVSIWRIQHLLDVSWVISANTFPPFYCYHHASRSVALYENLSFALAG